MPTIKPSHLVYQGSFRLPRMSGSTRFGYGGHAMSVNQGNGNLFISGHSRYGLVAEVIPPSILSTDEEVARAKLSPDGAFFDPAPGLLEIERNEFGLDSLGGIHARSSDLLSSWFRYYGVQPVVEIDDPTLAILHLPDRYSPHGNHKGLFHIGPKEVPHTQKATSGYMFGIPAEWCDANGVPGQTLACGRGDGAGNATSPKGPALFAVDPDTPSKSTVLLHRPVGEEPPGWTPCDRWTGGAWIQSGTFSGVMFVGAVGIGPYWYGTPIHELTSENGETQILEDKWDRSKGYHCVSRQVVMHIYSADDLGRAARGEESPGAIVPVYRAVLPNFHEAAPVRACAYDVLGQKLYILEHGPMEFEAGAYPGEDPKVHVYAVTATSEPEPTDPDPVDPPAPTDSPSLPSGPSLELQVDGRTFRVPLIEIIDP